MLVRSLLFIPANSPKMLLKSNVMQTDFIIFDLEDGVAEDRKAEARELLRAYLTSGLVSCRYMIRVNRVGSAAFQADLASLQGVPFAGLYLPKVEEPEEVRAAAAALDALEQDTPGIPRRFLFNTVETPLGLEQSFACLRASDRVAGVCLGSEDYAAAMGVSRSADYTELDYARRRLVTAAKAAGKAAVDTVFADVKDLDGLRRESLYAKQLGYDGKAAVSPAQISVIHQAFLPKEAEIRRAKAVVEAFAQARQQSSGIALLDGAMIDKPVLEQAEAILQAVQSIGMQEQIL